jgi:hypothetical protein
MSIKRHLGNGEFKSISNNKELVSSGNLRITKRGALSDVSWFRKTIGIGRLNVEMPTKKSS